MLYSLRLMRCNGDAVDEIHADGVMIYSAMR